MPYKIQVLEVEESTWKTFQDGDIADGYCRWETYVQADNAVRLFSEDMPDKKFRAVPA